MNANETTGASTLLTITHAPKRWTVKISECTSLRFTACAYVDMAKGGGVIDSIVVRKGGAVLPNVVENNVLGI